MALPVQNSRAIYEDSAYLSDLRILHVRERRRDTLDWARFNRFRTHVRECGCYGHAVAPGFDGLAVFSVLGIFAF